MLDMKKKRSLYFAYFSRSFNSKLFFKKLILRLSIYICFHYENKFYNYTGYMNGTSKRKYFKRNFTKILPFKNLNISKWNWVLMNAFVIWFLYLHLRLFGIIYIYKYLENLNNSNQMKLYFSVFYTINSRKIQ